MSIRTRTYMHIYAYGVRSGRDRGHRPRRDRNFLQCALKTAAPVRHKAVDEIRLAGSLNEVEGTGIY